jgi:hypothetical protein
MLISLYSVLIVTICDKGGCPHPQSLIPKKHLPGLGTTSATKLHTRQLCSDTTQHREKIIQAHDLIYDKGYQYNLLQEMSEEEYWLGLFIGSF